MNNVPAGHECERCGGRVESLVTDWADDEGRSLVAEQVPMFCPACTSLLPGRRVWHQGKVEVSVEGVYGVRALDVRATRT